ncbi:MAG: lysylphosphatidylglycerol synthase transmembrane domain-containing protein [Myxococcota bacterium]|nr:lysylphosphatidylglycerol synthase transmembrane domain-containing protein [Myxococcota bacterium]
MNTSEKGDLSRKPGFNRRTALLIAGFGFSGFGLWYIFRDIQFNELLASWHRIRILPLIGTVVLYWSAMLITRSYLIKHLLRPIGELSLGKAYRYISIGFLANNILPMRMGEVVRIGGISRASGIGFASVTGAVAVERLLDLGMAALVGVLAVQVAPLLPESIRFAVLASGAGLFCAFAALVVLARRGLKEKPRGTGKSLKVTISNLIARFAAGLGALGTSRGIAGAVALSMSFWAMFVLMMLLRLVAFDLPPSLPMVLVLITSISLSVTLPSAPAYVGVYHIFVVGALRLFDVEESVAVGFAVFTHLVDLIPGCLIGLISMAVEGLRMKDLKQESPSRHASITAP